MNLPTTILAATVATSHGLVAAHGSTDTEGSIVSLFIIAAAAAISPLLSSLTRKRVPDVVWLLILGVAVGPNALGFASLTEPISVFREVGMGMLFLIAGTEIDVQEVHGSAGKRSLATWLTCFGIGLAVSWVAVAASGTTGVGYSTYIALAIALTSTALGTLLPILMEAGVMGTTIGKAVLVHGAIGELAPIVAMSLLLSARSPWLSFGVLMFFVLATIVAVAIPTRFVLSHPEIGRTILHGAQTSQKTLMRVVMVILTGLMALSAVLDLDMVLGAFAAGIIVRALAPGNFTMIEGELRTLGFSFLIPLFFVTSGMTISLSAVAAHPFLLVSLVGAILLVRGVPIVALERFHGTIERVGWSDATRIGLYGATGLPIIVAVTGLASSTGIIPTWLASLLVVAGALSVLLFPLLAFLLGRAVGKHG
ncbi:cation:proton antiporter [Actinomyces sp. ICM47]|uniref:cation:proton antiporter n=1 Tax=Actinomyces sp. ICM47 TaxID=936548 RepID=UPI0025C6725C|nr:cation:proton antiporter [Actinomyces sp. ICM47]